MFDILSANYYKRWNKFRVETKEIYFDLQRVIVPRRPLIRRNLAR